MANSPKEMFDTVLTQKIQEKGDEMKQLGVVYKFNITGDQGGTWRLKCNDDLGIEEGDGDADVTYTLSDSDFVDMVQGNLNPQMAFMTQKLKVEGDMGMALKLGNFL